MTVGLVIALMVGLPLVLLTVILLIFWCVGRFYVRPRQRDGRITYRASTSSDSNSFTSNGM